MKAICHLAFAIIMACAALPARSTVDCLRSQAGFSAKAGSVIAYRDETSLNASEDEMLSVEKELRDGVLLDYFTKLEVKSDNVRKLVFLICGSTKTRTTLSRVQDAVDLNDLRVTLAMWRVNERGQPGVLYAVIPNLARSADPSELSDRWVIAADAQPVAGEATKVWVQSLQRNAAMLKALLGMGLGMQYLDAQEGHNAKLVLCKGKKDLLRSVDLLLKPQRPAKELVDAVNKLIDEANEMIASRGSRADKDQQRRIDAACGS